MSKISPFAIHKTLIGIGGEPKSVKRLRSGDLLIETISDLQTKSFLLAKTFLNSPVTANNNKKRFEYYSNKHIILTFNNPKLPTTVKAGYLSCKIRSYIPNPLRFFKCQRLGHSQTSYRGQLTCSICASVGHSSTDCILEPKYINCSQSHPSNSKLCPKWKIEKKIQEIKTNNNISYIKAKKLMPPQLFQTYAQATKSSPISVTTQTDENITKIKCPPLNVLPPLSSPTKQNILHYSPAVTKASSSHPQLLPTISSITSTVSPAILSDAKENFKEQPSQAHCPRKISKKTDLKKVKPTKNLKDTPIKTQP
ncbi:uncharacterized protein TNCV_838701 [Trichonephila clavipes]|nr:uncharacterized protein TNCV_838701 [Trichonephila clavipes]